MKAPGSKRLTLKHGKLLSNVAFKFNLRRYSMDRSINPLSCEPSMHDVDPYQVSKGLHSPDLWEGRRRATTSGMSTMQPTKILLFPAVFDRPRELLKPARKDCARQEPDAYGTKKKNLWVTEKRLMRFQQERWKVGPGGLCSPRHRLQFNSILEGRMWMMTWQA